MDLWADFIKSTAKVDRRAGKIEGVARKHLSLMGKAVVDLGKELFENSGDSWKFSFRPDQKSYFMDACAELQNSLNLLMKIHSFRTAPRGVSFQEAPLSSVDPLLEMSDRRGGDGQERQDQAFSPMDPMDPVDPYDCPGTSYPLQDNYALGGIKEEPEYAYASVKEEPLSDVFCPGTGGARPHGAYTEEQEVTANAPETEPFQIVTDEEADWEPTNGRPLPKTCVPIMSKTMLKCHLCGSKTKIVYATPEDPFERADFLDLLIQRQYRDKMKIEMLQRNTLRAYFCMLHVVLPSNVKKPKLRGSKLERGKKVYLRDFVKSQEFQQIYSKPEQPKEREMLKSREYHQHYSRFEEPLRKESIEEQPIPLFDKNQSLNL
ncbi:hypothetical protein PMAYCL1PPCAC_04709 [Pristionchus mayeri]|uniref:Uncharacterized protein n=1 Tax=Pristionchus mayeri TaxID=1317129 RepID=A0AAN4Z7F7_9BILA|nr:hypothetical protein PMAYCL1PPCAC_04709 [Pristionchus mayeri]